MNREQHRKHFLIFTIIFSLVLLASCRKVRIVPEITGALYDENVLDLKGKELAGRIIKHGNEVLFITVDGQLFRWNPAERIINYLYNLNQTIDPQATFYNNNGLLILKIKTAQSNSKYLLFHVEQMKEITQLTGIDVQKVLALDQDVLVYKTPANQVVFYRYMDRKTLKVQEAANDTVFNARIQGGQIYLLTTSRLFIYNKAQNSLTGNKLKYFASSPFLMDGKWMFYGTENRELVKVSLRNHVDWRYQIGDLLTSLPVKVGPYVVIIPRDNNIYFFNNNGTLYWWEKLNSTKLMAPVAMKENAVAFLWDNRIKFFDYKKKRVVSFPLHEWVAVYSNPVSFGEYIYFVGREKLKEGDENLGLIPNQWLSKIGNNYGVEVNADPKFIWPKGKSIKVTLDSFNMIEPEYHVKVFKVDNDGNTLPNGLVFEKDISRKEKPTFVWVPKEARAYRMDIKIDAENRKGVIVQETFETLDIERILKTHFYKLHEQSGKWQ